MRWNSELESRPRETVDIIYSSFKRKIFTEVLNEKKNYIRIIK